MFYSLNTKLSIAIAFIFAGFLMTSCDDSTTGVQPSESNVKIYTVKNIEATGGSRGSAGNYVLYSLTKNKVIAKEDSATAKWDIGFSGRSIIINNTVSGPGEAGAVALDVPFDQVTQAPENKAYKTDTDTSHALTYDSWGRYTGGEKPKHAILPEANETIIIKTADGKHYAKIKFISWYKGNPDITSNEFANWKTTRAPGGYYTFKYAIQENGSRSLK